MRDSLKDLEHIVTITGGTVYPTAIAEDFGRAVVRTVPQGNCDKFGNGGRRGAAPDLASRKSWFTNQVPWLQIADAMLRSE